MTYNFPDGPSPLPFVGNFFDVDTAAIHLSLYEHRDLYGDLSHFRIFGKNFVVMNTPDAIREVKSNANLTMDRPNDFVKSYILSGDINTTDESQDWTTMRSIVGQSIQSHIEDVDILRITDDEMIALASRLKGHGEEPVDIRDIISDSTSNIMQITFIGMRFNYKHEMFDFIHKFLAGVGDFLKPSVRSIINIFPSVRNLPFWLGSSFDNAKEGSVGMQEHMLYKVMEEKPLMEKNGVMQKLIRAQHAGGAMTEQNLKSVCLDSEAATVVFKSAITCLVYHLVCNPWARDRVYEEILKVIGVIRRVDIKDRDDMPFTHAFVLESMRVTSVAPSAIPFCNAEDVKIRNYHIPKNTIFISNLWRINHDPDIFDEPWCFKPDRFLDCNGTIAPEDSSIRQNLIAFGIGRRCCIGTELANTRAFLYLVHLVQTFHVRSDEISGGGVDPRSFTAYRGALFPPIFKVQLKERDDAISQFC